MLPVTCKTIFLFVSVQVAFCGEKIAGVDKIGPCFYTAAYDFNATSEFWRVWYPLMAQHCDSTGSVCYDGCKELFEQVSRHRDIISEKQSGITIWLYFYVGMTLAIRVKALSCVVIYSQLENIHFLPYGQKINQW